MLSLGNIARIDPRDANDVWPQVSGAVKKAIVRDPFERLTAADIYLAVRNDLMELWIAGEAVGVTELAQYPQKRVCNVVCVAGNLEDWFHAVPDIEAWAVGMGCDVIMCDGRKGWARKMREHGWGLESTLVGRKL